VNGYSDFSEAMRSVMRPSTASIKADSAPVQFEHSDDVTV
jgi:hypothetical protein